MVDRTEQRILEVARTVPGPFSVSFASKKLQVHWLTARALLLRLVAEGKIEGEQVLSGGWIFRAKKEVAQVVKT